MESQTIEFIHNMSSGEIRLILDTDPSLPTLLEIFLLQELVKRTKASGSGDDK